MKDFRKKPVVIQAIQLSKDNVSEVLKWLGVNPYHFIVPTETEANPNKVEVTEEGVLIPTLEGKMLASWTDYIIKGVNGEFYPCKPDIFRKTYDEVVDRGVEYFDFGTAIYHLKAGELVSRKGWNGKNMFLFIRPEDILETGFIPKVKSLPDSVKEWIDKYIDDKINPGEEGLTPVKFTRYICMKAADNSIVNGWLASQTDMLAEDWYLVKP